MLPYCNKLDVVPIWILILDLMVNDELFILYFISACIMLETR